VLQVIALAFPIQYETEGHVPLRSSTQYFFSVVCDYNGSRSHVLDNALVIRGGTVFILYTVHVIICRSEPAVLHSQHTDSIVQSEQRKPKIKKRDPATRA
jgi:hypothetical protein